MRAAEDRIRRRYTRLGFDGFPGRAVHSLGQHTKVHERERNSRAAIVKNQRLGVKIIVNVPTAPFREASGQ